VFGVCQIKSIGIKEFRCLNVDSSNI
jgi:hypothetical protein